MPQVSRSRHRVRPDVGQPPLDDLSQKGIQQCTDFHSPRNLPVDCQFFTHEPVRSDRCGPPAAAVAFPSQRGPGSFGLEDLIGGRPCRPDPRTAEPSRRTPVEDRPAGAGRKCRGHLAPRRQARPGRTADRPGPARAGVLRAPARRGRPRAAGQLRHERAPGLPAAGDVHRGPHPGHHPGDLRLPRAGRGSTARSTWARTRTRCPGRPSGRRWRCSRPTGSRRSSSATTG